jgi:hypothetical protein
VSDKALTGNTICGMNKYGSFVVRRRVAEKKPTFLDRKTEKLKN